MLALEHALHDGLAHERLAHRAQLHFFVHALARLLARDVRYLLIEPIVQVPVHHPHVAPVRPHDLRHCRHGDANGVLLVLELGLLANGEWTGR